MIGHLQKSWEWFKERAEGAHTKGWLLFLSFTESAVFVIPPDPLLAAIMLAGSSRWLYYTTITTAAAVLGAVFGYLLGAFFFDTVGTTIISTYGLGEQFELVKTYFGNNTFGVMFFAAFTPIPFKIFVLAGGFLKVNFIAFLLASILGRGTRYLIVSYATYRWGEYALYLARTYTIHITVASFILFALYILHIIQ